MKPRERGPYFVALFLLCFLTFGQHIYPQWAARRQERAVNAAVTQAQHESAQPTIRRIQGANRNRYAVSLAIKPTFKDAPQLVGSPSSLISLHDEARRMQVFVMTSDEEHFANQGYFPCLTILQEQKQAQSYLLTGKQLDSTGYAGHEKCSSGAGSFVMKLNRRFPNLNGLIVSCHGSAPAGTPLGKGLLGELLAICWSVKVKPI